MPKLNETHLLILSSLRASTGNSVTAARLARTIGAARVSTCDITSVGDAAQLRAFVAAQNVGLVMGIHAYRSGRLLVGSRVPFAIVLGGTDMNVNMDQVDKRAVMAQAVGEAGAVIAFNEELRDKLLRATPGAAAKTFLVPQAVCTDLRAGPPTVVDGAGGCRGGYGSGDGEAVRRERDEVRAALRVRVGAKLLLLPAGLRPVKDVLYAARGAAAWNADSIAWHCIA
jgi:hypothetical protein